jgi:hypothetical protein
VARKANVTLMANVPDLGELLASSRIALAPIKWTPGPNLKILDALAVGTPVLTFRAAAAQLPDPLHGVVICDSAEEMALIATELLVGERAAVPPPVTSGWSDRADTLAVIVNGLLGNASPPSESQRAAPSKDREEGPANDSGVPTGVPER